MTKTKTLVNIWRMDRHKCAWLSRIMQYLEPTDDQLKLVIGLDDDFNDLKSLGYESNARELTAMIKDVSLSERREMRLNYLVWRKGFLENELKNIRNEIKLYQGIDEFMMHLTFFQLDTKKMTTELWSIEREMKMLNKPESERKNSLMPDQIERARQFPIEQLLNKKRGERIPCPFHNGTDKNMILKGTAYCFVCSEKADSIRWLMHFNDLSFRQAVEELS